MKVRDISTMMISAVVSIIVIVAVMVPLIDAGTKTNMDVEQNTTMYFSALKDYGGEVVITPANEGLEINGVHYGNGFIASSEYIIQFFPHSNWYQCDLYSIELGKISSIDLITIHEDGTITVIAEEVEYSTTTNPEYVFIPNINGDWGNYRATHYYATYGQIVYSMSSSTFTEGETSNSVLWFSKMKDGKYYDVGAYLLDSESNTYTPTDISIVDRTDLTYNKGNYYSGTAVSVTWDDITIIDAYDMVFAPVEYKVETQDQGLINGLLAMLPIFTVIGLVIGILSWYRVRT